MNKIQIIIDKYELCQEAVDYMNSKASFKEAWNDCTRGDWMLWLAFKLNVNVRILTLTKGYCAKTVIHLMKDKISSDAVKVAIRFGRYNATMDELDKAYDAAYATGAYVIDAAAASAYATVGGYTTDVCAASDAAYAAADACTADASYTTAPSYTTDAYAASVVAKKQNQSDTANICRKYLTKSIFSKLNKL